MREQLIRALLAHAQGEIEKPKANVEVYFTNPVGIGEHPQYTDEMDKLLELIANAEDKKSSAKNHD